MIKVVDIFAGPGGLGEGFSSVTTARNKQAYDVVLSVEMEQFAHQTLTLRTFFRQFPGEVPQAYYRHLRGEISREELFDAFPAQAERAISQCWRARLGPNGVSPDDVRQRINKAIGKDHPWVLIGGPPCQAYSLVGRSRNRGKADYDPSKDVRQTLYVEYLQILADHQPAVFIMENVKGLLSATVGNVRMFHRILEDLRQPSDALMREGRSKSRQRSIGYRIFSLAQPQMFEDDNLEASVIRAEEYGIPQSRHRVILLGIREDLVHVRPGILTRQDPIPVQAVIGSLPRLRSGLSRGEDSAQAWRRCLESQIDSSWATQGAQQKGGRELRDLIQQTLNSITLPYAGRGDEFIKGSTNIKHPIGKWYLDDKLQGVCNHSTRGHMESDLYRYLYASCYAQVHKRSPSLQHFPEELLPSHENIDTRDPDSSHFADRFRVQLADRPSTTVVSHISKDGHYYIHPDPGQCRSLTVREAA